MAVVQSTYATSQPVAVAGQIANMETANIVTKQVEDAGGIGFGKAVFQGTEDDEVTATASTLFKGITVKDVTVENDDTPDEYVVGASAGVMNLGVIWVLAGGTVAAGEAVFVDGAGDFIESASGATALSGVTFETSGADGDLVQIRLK